MSHVVALMVAMDSGKLRVNNAYWAEHYDAGNEGSDDGSGMAIAPLVQWSSRAGLSQWMPEARLGAVDMRRRRGVASVASLNGKRASVCAWMSESTRMDG